MVELIEKALGHLAALFLRLSVVKKGFVGLLLGLLACGPLLIPYFDRNELARQLMGAHPNMRIPLPGRQWEGGQWRQEHGGAWENVNPLVIGRFDIYRDDSGKYDEITEFEAGIRWSTLVVGGLALIGVIVVLALISVGAEGPPAATVSPKLHRSRNDRPAPPAVSSRSAEDVLYADVSRVRGRATELYRRSTLLLAGGVAMAFFGVILFYMTLPEIRETEDARHAVVRTIRPTGMLIFVEGVAWFLLRQYRALIEDYKVFFNIYLRRTNFLIALKLLTTTALNEDQKAFFSKLLTEEQAVGRMKQGETTEGLERAKLSEPNPLVEVLRELKEIIPKLEKK
jgi:hypothetical protein